MTESILLLIEESILVSVFRVLDMICFSFFNIRDSMRFSIHVQCSFSLKLDNREVIAEYMFHDKVLPQSNGALLYAWNIDLEPIPEEDRLAIDNGIETINNITPLNSSCSSISSNGVIKIAFEDKGMLQITPDKSNTREQWRIITENNPEMQYAFSNHHIIFA